MPLTEPYTPSLEPRLAEPGLVAQRCAVIQFSLEPIADQHAVEDLWRKLEAASEVSFFVSWTWIGTWLRCLPERIRPLLLTASMSGETVAAAILVSRKLRRRGLINVKQFHFNATGEPAFDCLTIEHNGFVGASGSYLWRAFLDWFAQHAPGDELIVPGVIEGAMEESQGFGTVLHFVDKKPAFVARLPPGGLEAIIDVLSRNARQQLRRNFRDLAALGDLRCEVADTPCEAMESLSELKELHIRSWTMRGQPHAFRYPFAETFLRALIDEGVPGQSVQLLRISAGSHLLGYLLNFRHAGRVCAYQSGFEHTKSKYRPGYVSHALSMEWNARRGAEWYDFLAGDNRLKRTFADLDYWMAWHQFGKRILVLQMEYAARLLANTLRSCTATAQAQKTKPTR